MGFNLNRALFDMTMHVLHTCGAECVGCGKTVSLKEGTPPTDTPPTALCEAFTLMEKILETEIVEDVPDLTIRCKRCWIMLVVEEANSFMGTMKTQYPEFFPEKGQSNVI